MGAIMTHGVDENRARSRHSSSRSAIARMTTGRAEAGKASLVEFGYATVAAGLAGAVTQRLRHAVPRAATAVVVFAEFSLAALLPK